MCGILLSMPDATIERSFKQKIKVGCEPKY